MEPRPAKSYLCRQTRRRAQLRRAQQRRTEQQRAEPRRAEQRRAEKDDAAAVLKPAKRDDRDFQHGVSAP